MRGWSLETARGRLCALPLRVRVASRNCHKIPLPCFCVITMVFLGLVAVFGHEVFVRWYMECFFSDDDEATNRVSIFSHMTRCERIDNTNTMINGPALPPALLPPPPPLFKFEQDAVALLEEKSTMLDEYFMTKLSRGRESGGDGDDGGSGDGKKRKQEGQQAGELCLNSLPLLLEGHSPVPEGLPMFLLRLATEVCRLDNISHKTVHRGGGCSSPLGGTGGNPPQKAPYTGSAHWPRHCCTVDWPQTTRCIVFWLMLFYLLSRQSTFWLVVSPCLSRCASAN